MTGLFALVRMPKFPINRYVFRDLERQPDARASSISAHGSASVDVLRGVSVRAEARTYPSSRQH